MILPDVNILLYAYRADTPNHRTIFSWLKSEVGSGLPFGLSDQILAGFLRIVTHPRIFNPPSPLKSAQKFADELRGQSNCVQVNPGENQWRIFSELCVKADARGNLLQDAWFAALAMEHGCEWITTDRDYGRFPGLKWRHPLEKGRG